MNKKIHFEGRVILKNKQNKTFDQLNYLTTPYECEFQSLIMTSFTKFKFSKREKINLTNIDRKKINQFLNINFFELKSDSEELIKRINLSTLKYVTIEASDYGAYICLAALYSGKLKKDMQIIFELHECPLKLFPKSFLKHEPFKKHTFNLFQETTCWTNKITSMQSNKSFNNLNKKAA